MTTRHSHLIRMRFLVLAAGLLLPGAFSGQQAQSQPLEGEADSLFDGQSLAGWVVASGYAQYTVEDGAIVGTTAEGSPNTFLCTTRDYANFELTFEVQCDAELNSGVQIRSHIYLQDTPQPSEPSRVRQAGEVYGYQCEIAPGEETSGNFWDEGRHTRWHDDFADNPQARAAYREGTWNAYRILAQGNRIRSWVNGVPCADFESDLDPSGFIGLQVHSVASGTGPYRVRWRNLQLRELSINPGINDNFQAPDVQQYVGRFESESREVYDQREEIVAALELRRGMTVADIGAGTGFFTRMFARAVGEQGKVFAVDVAENFVQHVEQSAREEGLNNVTGVVCSQTDTNLPTGSVDVAFICDVYHHFEFPYHTMRSLQRALRPGGRVILVDFVREPGVSSEFVMGHVRANEAQFSREIEQSGFRRIGRADFLTENYLVSFRKAEAPTDGEGRTIRTFDDLSYRSGNDAWTLDAYLPPGSFARPRPALVLAHGGGWFAGDKSAGPWQLYGERFARLGYVTLSVNYRLTDEAPFPACVEDVKCAVRWLRAHAEHFGVDSNRIGAHGNSAGAHLVAMLGLAGPDAKLEGDGPYTGESSAVQAVSASATPTDFANWHRPIDQQRSIAALLAGPAETLEERIRRASPITYVDAEAPPFFLVHGGNDTTVDVSQAERFVEALRSRGAKQVEYRRYDDAGHGVFVEHADELLPALEAFFARTLGSTYRQ